jgi:hypothetical protein
MRLELEKHAHASFITLTYRDAEVPARLDYRDMQEFFKRFRRSFPGPVRFFCCGEYGSKTHRPHWHAILFLGRSPMVDDSYVTTAWGHGFVHLGSVTPQSMAYVANYAMKNGPLSASPVVRMSRRPGLGLERLREIAACLVPVTPELPRTPFWVRFGRKKYPLDLRGREVFLDEYTKCGGTVLAPVLSPMLMDYEAELVTLMGDPHLDLLPAVKVLALDHRERERHVIRKI